MGKESGKPLRSGGLSGDKGISCAGVWRRHGVEHQDTEPALANPFRGTSFDSKTTKWAEVRREKFRETCWEQAMEM